MEALSLTSDILSEKSWSLALTDGSCPDDISTHLLSALESNVHTLVAVCSDVHRVPNTASPALLLPNGVASSSPFSNSPNPSPGQEDIILDTIRSWVVNQPCPQTWLLVRTKDSFLFLLGSAFCNAINSKKCFGKQQG